MLIAANHRACNSFLAQAQSPLSIAWCCPGAALGLLSIDIPTFPAYASVSSLPASNNALIFFLST
jgi:hypothetical protein